MCQLQGQVSEKEKVKHVGFAATLITGSVPWTLDQAFRAPVFSFVKWEGNIIHIA